MTNLSITVNSEDIASWATFWLAYIGNLWREFPRRRGNRGRVVSESSGQLTTLSPPTETDRD